MVGALSGGAPPDELRATLILQALPGVGDRRLQALVARFGSASEALAAPGPELADTAGTPAAGARRDPQLADRVDAALRWCRENGVRTLLRADPDYPERLGRLDNPPAVLFLQGDPSLMAREIVTIVGSRKSTEYGRRVARDVATVAVRHGAVVASGLALGIDGQAHAAALEGGGTTLAVLGGGLARPYPRSHTRLHRRIARDGLLISEFLPDEEPFSGNFLRRNRILAALAKVVVIVEAGETSGALNTVNHAGDVGTEVLTVPGPIYARQSQGTNALIGKVGTLVRPSQILEFLDAGRPETLSLFPEAWPEDLGPEALRLWHALEEAPRHVDDLCQAARVAPGVALEALSLLEIDGWVRQEPGARFVRGSQQA